MKSSYLWNLVDISAEDRVQCTIHEVRVDPCREAEERKPCSLRRGRNASISFDYTARKYTQSIIYD